MEEKILKFIDYVKRNVPNAELAYRYDEDEDMWVIEHNIDYEEDNWAVAVLGVLLRTEFYSFGIYNIALEYIYKK